MQPHILIFYLLMFFVAFLYASVGHGGGSGYLALMAMFGVAPFIMHSTALTLDLFVSITSFTLFYKGKHFDLKMFLPLAIASVPMAFLGGLMSIDGSIYKKILGVLLLIIVARFIFFRKIEITKTKKASVSGSVLLGALIGFASGLIGIGGGIILSPILLLLGWADQKKTAAISALFIFVNALAGLGGLAYKGNIHFNDQIFLYIFIAFTGGVTGSYFGAVKFKQSILKNVLASILFLAAFKLLYTFR